MPQGDFIPGPGDSLAGQPLQQMGTLMAILRENQQAKLNVQKNASDIAEATARTSFYQQQATMMGLQIQDEPQESAARAALQSAQTKSNLASAALSTQQLEYAPQEAQSRIGLQNAQAGGIQQQTLQAALESPTKVMSLQADADMRQAQADRDQMQNDQIKQFNQEWSQHGGDVMKQLFPDNPAMQSFSKTLYGAQAGMTLQKTQFETNEIKQHGDMLEALAGYQSQRGAIALDRVRSTSEYKALAAIQKDPTMAHAFIHDSNPIVSQAAQAVSDSLTNSGKAGGKVMTVGQALGTGLYQKATDPNSSPEDRAKAAVMLGEFSGVKPEIIPEHLDPESGMSIPTHADYAGLLQKFSQLGPIFSQPSQTAQTSPPPSTQPTRVMMVSPDGKTKGMVPQSQVEAAKAKGYSEAQ